jgi:hypothetical protein
MRNNYEEFSMNMSSALPDGVRSLLACLAASILAGCSIVPGNQSYSNREESDVRLPVQQGDVLAPANVKIKPITAELIIDMFKAARPPVGDGTSSARAATQSKLRGPAERMSNRYPNTGWVRATSSRSSSGTIRS